MSVVLIGGGTAGCIIAAKGGVYIPAIGNHCLLNRLNLNKKLWAKPKTTTAS